MRSDAHEHFDAVIAGAGMAGLSLVSQLLDRTDFAGRVALVDRSFAAPDGKEWCFWGPGELPFAELASHRWTRMQVRAPQVERSESIESEPYFCVRSDDYSSHIHSRIDSDRRVVRIESGIADLADTADGAVVTLADGRQLTAPVAFNSVRRAPQDITRRAAYPLWQQFVGWEVETGVDAFDPATITLMDFDIPAAQSRTAFIYVLPFSHRRALIEATVFAPDRVPEAELEAMIVDWIAARLPGISTETIRTETGRIPMMETTPSPLWGRHIFNIGTVGGATKPTTGYTFQRTHTRNRQLIDSWLQHGRPIAPPSAPLRFRFYDLLLLSILHDRPQRSVPVFSALFRHNRLTRMLRFIDERTSLVDEARLFARLPWRTFLAAALRSRRALPHLWPPASESVPRPRAGRRPAGIAPTPADA
jgi:lycopene beta-cyclase